MYKDEDGTDLQKLAESTAESIRHLYAYTASYPDTVRKHISDLNDCSRRLISELCALDVIPTIIAERKPEKQKVKDVAPKRKRGRPRKV